MNQIYLLLKLMFNLYGALIILAATTISSNFEILSNPDNIDQQFIWSTGSVFDDKEISDS